VVVRIDMNQAEDTGGYEPLEAGIYDATVTKFALSDRKTRAGAPMYEAEFTLENNRRAWKTYAIQPNALWVLKQDLPGYGITLPEDGQIEFDEADIVGQDVRIQLSKKPHYNKERAAAGEMENEVVKVLAPADGGSADW